MAAKIRGWSPVAASRIKKTISVELVMTKDIARADVSLELLKARMEDAGYETMTENGEMFVFRTGFSLRIQNFFENASLRMRVHIFLNKEITDAMLHSFVAKLNADSYSVKFSAYRWDDGDVGLFGDCVLYYPFGLNFPSFMFLLRRLIDVMQGVLKEYGENSAYFPRKE